MELGHKGGNRKLRQFDIFVGGFETFVEVDGPFAGDVVGNFDVADVAALEELGDNVISVDIAIKSLALFVSLG
jgi:hypothetical protein